MESQWRITEQNPIRSGPGRMDFERCAALHNEIIERGWIGSGRALEDLNRTTYYERWHDSPEWNSEHYHPSIIEFFKLAIIEPEGHAFFYNVGVMLSPTCLFDRVNLYGEDHQFINLYCTNGEMGVSHSVGIVLDQPTSYAIYQPGIDDSTSTLLSQRLQWMPLEIILDMFLDLIDEGKVVAVSKKPDSRSAMGCGKVWEKPWVMQSFSEKDLSMALENFEGLVEAIEKRMPPGSLPDGPIQYGCLDFAEGEDGVESSDTKIMMEEQEFATKFLAKARRPRFDFIAPGLRWVGGGTQPFASKDNTDNSWAVLRPVLLARGDEPLAGEQYGLTNCFEDAADVPCGLYLTETNHFDAIPFEDGCRIELPFKLGRNRHGRRSDGTFFGEGMKAWPLNMVPPDTCSSNDVHQQGWNFFIGWHDSQLRDVLYRWLELVESGYWEVDADGVAGGIEKWKEADSEEHWQKYQLGVRW